MEIDRTIEAQDGRIYPLVLAVDNTCVPESGQSSKCKTCCSFIQDNSLSYPVSIDCVES